MTTAAMYLIWLRIALVLYGIASLSVLPDVLTDTVKTQPVWRRIALPAAVAAVLFNFVALAEMLTGSRHRIPASPHEMQTLLGLLLGAGFLLVYWRYRAVSIGVFVLPLVFLLLLLPALGPDRYVFPSPLIRGGWIFLHVALLLAAYSALIFSLLSSLLYLMQERRLKSKNLAGLFRKLPPLETIDQIAYKMLLIGFPCMTLGLLAGCLIAQEQVGAAYFVDPKVLLSFAMWGVYVVMLLIRRNAGLRGRRAVYLSSFVVLVMLTVWVANQFSSVHRYTNP